MSVRQILRKFEENNMAWRFKNEIIETIEDWISQEDNLLDIGCGNMVTMDLIKSHFQCKIQGTDIIDYRRRDYHFTLMPNLIKLPFSDGSFDVGLLIAVLHHSLFPGLILAEALRVAKRVIIYESEGGMVASIMDIVLSRIYESKVSCPLAFKKPDEWIECFKAMGAEYEFRRIKPVFFSPFKTFAFCLRKGE